MKKIALSKQTLRVLTASETQAVAGADLYPQLPPYSSRPDRCPVSGLCAPNTVGACAPPPLTQAQACQNLTQPQTACLC